MKLSTMLLSALLAIAGPLVPCRAADCALSGGEVRIEREAGDGSRDILRRFASTTVLVRDGDGWRFSAVRAVPPPAAAPVPAPATASR